MKKIFQKILQSSKTTFWGIQQLFIAAPLETLAVSIFVFFQGMIPAASLYAIQEIVDWISASSSFPYFFLCLWGCMMFADIVLSPIVSVFRLRLNEKILEHCNLILMKKANTIESLKPFEDPHFYDQMQFLKNEASRKPMNFVYVLTDFTKDLLALLSILIVLSSIGWWIPLAILLSCIPHAASVLRFEKESWDQMLFRSPESRKMAWISSLVLDDRTAKELRLFNFGHFLIDKYKELVTSSHNVLFKKRWKQARLSVFLSSLTVLGNIVIITFILLKAKISTLHIGSLVISIQALVMTQHLLSGCISNIGMCAPILLFFDKLKSFLESNLCPITETKSSLAWAVKKSDILE